MEKEGHKCTSIEGGMDKQARDKVVKEFRCALWVGGWGERGRQQLLLLLGGAVQPTCVRQGGQVVQARG